MRKMAVLSELTLARVPPRGRACVIVAVVVGFFAGGGWLSPPWSSSSLSSSHSLYLSVCVCPVGQSYCAGPVNLTSVVGSNAWQKQSVAYIHLLNAVRYLLVWHPLILTAAHFTAIHVLGYHPLHGPIKPLAGPPA